MPPFSNLYSIMLEQGNIDQFKSSAYASNYKKSQTLIFQKPKTGCQAWRSWIPSPCRSLNC